MEVTNSATVDTYACFLKSLLLHCKSLIMSYWPTVRFVSHRTGQLEENV